MTVKVNGKKFNRDSDELYEGERPKEEGKLLRDFLMLVALAALGYGAFPWIVKGLAWLFGPLVHYL